MGVKYEDYKNIINKLAWKWTYTLNSEVDTLKSEANIVFVEILNDFDESKGNFSTLLYSSVENHFKNILKQNNRIKRQKIAVEFIDEIHAPAVMNIEDNICFKNSIDMMSNEAKEIVNVILEAPSGLLNMLPKPNISLRQVVKYFSAKGWERKKINKTINEIKMGLK